MSDATPAAETLYLSAVVTAHGELRVDTLDNTKSGAISNAVGRCTQAQGGTPEEQAERQTRWLKFKANGDTVRRVVLVDSQLWSAHNGVTSWATELVRKLTGKRDSPWTEPDTRAELWELVDDIRTLANKATHPVPFAFDAEVRWILGQPNFTAGQYARLLRKDGHVIPTKAEEEQAAVAYWMLGLYLQHGATWRTQADSELRRMQALDPAYAAGRGA